MEKEHLFDNKEKKNSTDCQQILTKPTMDSNRADVIFKDKAKPLSLFNMLILIDESENSLDQVPIDNSMPEYTLHKKSIRDILESKNISMNCSIDEMNKNILKELNELSDSEHDDLISRISSMSLQHSNTSDSVAQLLREFYDSLSKAEPSHLKKNSNKQFHNFSKISDDNYNDQVDIQKKEQLYLKESEVIKNIITLDKGEIQQKVHSQKQEKKKLIDVITKNKDKTKFEKRIELFKNEDKAYKLTEEKQFYQNKVNFKKQEFEYYKNLGLRKHSNQFFEGN